MSREAKGVDGAGNSFIGVVGAGVNFAIGVDGDGRAFNAGVDGVPGSMSGACDTTGDVGTEGSDGQSCQIIGSMRGRWPSDDLLPEQLRQVGAAISASKVSFSGPSDSSSKSRVHPVCIMAGDAVALWRV